MKYTLIAVILAFSATAAHADVWTWSKNAGLEPKTPDAAYRVETKGLDVRVYEWTPETAPHMTCIMAWGTDHPAGMQCFEKARQ
jgi:hypothetical protein